jgi:hypothetical protein
MFGISLACDAPFVSVANKLIIAKRDMAFMNFFFFGDEVYWADA